MRPQTLSRRDFLKLAGAAAGGLALVSCSGGGGSGGSQVRIMVDSWALAYAPFKEMAEKFNASHPGVTIKVEPSPGGWMTKVVGQIRSDELQWSAAGVMSTYHDLATWITVGLIAPIDEYLSASTEKDAATFLSDMLPTVKDDHSYEGKLYGIPFSIENITYQWNLELFGKAGVSQAPKTWDELYESCLKLKESLAAAGNSETYALGFDLGHLNRNLGALFFSITDHPYTDDGWFAWDSEEMRESLRFMRKMSRAGLTPPNAGEGVEMYDLWTRGRLAGLYSCSSRGVWAQKTLGFDKVATSQIPTSDGETHSGTVFWSNSVSIFNKAPLPQQAVDFLIYACGPQNTDWHKAVIQAGTSPAFGSVYANLIEKDSTMADYRWMTGVRDQIQKSVPSPKNFYYAIQNEAWNRHRPEYLSDDSTMTEDEVIEKILQSSEEIYQTAISSIETVAP